MNDYDKWLDEHMSALHRSIMEDWRRQYPESYRAHQDKRDLAKISKMDVFPEETDNVVNDILARMMK